ncbi:MAG TPA: YoaK family protein [Gaiellaceae bacterium]|nr:YoaK family protein [Gaiellaceae bacterium]
MTVWDDVKGTAWPRADSPDGRLPPLLLALTLVTGLVDAVSYLKLGHVFVANMTGNVVFLGFGIAGAAGISIWASLTALGSFLTGSSTGGRLGRRLGPNRGRMLRGALLVQLAAVAVAVVVAAVSSDPSRGGSRYALIVFLAFSMGIQNAIARRLAVPELTTTVLTMTLTGIAADSTFGTGSGSKIGRRALAVGAMLLGALAGALLALKVDTLAPLIAAAAILALVAITAQFQVAQETT